MHRTRQTHVRLDEESLGHLNRFRRRSRQPLSRIVNAIVREFLESVRTQSRFELRRTRRPACEADGDPG